jgi:hypothetical protein
MGRFTKGGPATISTVKPSGTVKVWSASFYSADWISTAGKKNGMLQPLFIVGISSCLPS